jgi:hypothetical protein
LSIAGSACRGGKPSRLNHRDEGIQFVEPIQWIPPVGEPITEGQAARSA